MIYIIVGNIGHGKSLRQCYLMQKMKICYDCKNIYCEITNAFCPFCVEKETKNL